MPPEQIILPPGYLQAPGSLRAKRPGPDSNSCPALLFPRKSLNQQPAQSSQPYMLSCQPAWAIRAMRCHSLAGRGHALPFPGNTGHALPFPGNPGHAQPFPGSSSPAISVHPSIPASSRPCPVPTAGALHQIPSCILINHRHPAAVLIFHVYENNRMNTCNCGASRYGSNVTNIMAPAC